MPEDVAESDAEKDAGGLVGKGGGEALGDAFGVAEDVDRVGGLVGRDVDEAFDAELGGRLEQVEGAEHVGLDGLGGVPFEHVDVLERSRVEDDLGSVGLEDLANAVGLADVGQHDVVTLEVGAAVDGEQERVQRRLVAVEQDQGGRRKPDDLAAQLRPDRARRHR